jgi:hypothetical protein
MKKLNLATDRSAVSLFTRKYASPTM